MYLKHFIFVTERYENIPFCNFAEIMKMFLLNFLGTNK